MSAREFADRLGRRARRVGLAPTPGLCEALGAYYRLLELWNRKINLSALALGEGSDEAIDRLLIEPLVAAQHLSAEGAVSVLDIGSGGGSPAIPMKLAAPAISMRMIEAKTRKSAFLREAIRQLKLADTTVETARYEALLTRPELHETMDVVTLRAVRVEPRVLMSLQAFLRPDGRLFLFRGRSGPDVPGPPPPPLAWESTTRLVESLQSRLVILRKLPVGAPR
jgi:16S rRNA (guanine527-N7)-methyltransferase